MRSFETVNPDTKLTTKPLSKLKRGEGGIVIEMLNPVVALQFMEMGILPGEYISIDRIAPLGDPISVNVHGNMLSLRREQASTVLIQLQSR